MVPGMAPEQPRIWSAGAPEHRLAPSQGEPGALPIGSDADVERSWIAEVHGLQAFEEGRVKRTIFPREATAQEIADQINAMPKQTKG